MPLFVLSVRTNAREAEATLDALGRRQIPFAASQAVNQLARIAVSDLQTEMKRVFDRPTPFTLRAFAWKKSTKRSMTAEIFAREFAGKGPPGWKYLTPEVFGGARRMKRFELALEAALGSGFAMPGRGAPLNQYGNISPGAVEQILSALGAEPTGSNRTARSARRKGRKLQNYFVAHAKGDGSLLAIYKVVGRGNVEPVLVFSHRAPIYRKRLPYFETVQKSFDANRDAVFTRALEDAIATAK